MVTIDELTTRRAEILEAMANVRKAGQIIQTRNGKVQLPSLAELRAELADVDSQISAATSGGSFGTPMAYYSGKD